MEQDKVYFEVRVVEPGRMLIGASRGFAVGVTRWSDGDSDARLQENSCCALNQADLPTCLEFFVNGASFATGDFRELRHTYCFAPYPCTGRPGMGLHLQNSWPPKAKSRRVSEVLRVRGLSLIFDPLHCRHSAAFEVRGFKTLMLTRSLIG
ncbi:hypothetical protein TGP89_240260 [Toxoplasma gondii p89]|uniref:Uncharacterized protein n=2 Tax=Toxoplasma gondii TaxID=5811 RepID=A0A2T6IP70_TOXGO|nr:hypothetical protein TGP89_240260 [Toxoplasma gondii p89]PUA87139.1 hypothetical protein TGBR9_240260 [Toxoplasma gondii TgCATBr9]